MGRFINKKDNHIPMQRKNNLVSLLLLVMMVLGSSFAISIVACQDITVSGVYTVDANLTGTNSITNDWCLEVDADNVVIDCQGNSISNNQVNVSQEAIYLANGADADNVTVMNCNIKDGYGIGVDINGDTASNNLVTNSNFSNVSSAIRITNGADNSNVTNNIITNVSIGVNLLAGGNNNVVSNNTISTFTSSGILVQSAGTGNTIELNTIENATNIGISVRDTSTTTVQNNTLGNLTGSSTAGIFFWGTSPNGIARYNDIDGTNFGIRLGQTGLPTSSDYVHDNLINNTVSNGIYIDGGGSNFTIDNNTIYNSGGDGINAILPTATQFRDNLVVGSSDDGIVTGSSSNINVTGNNFTSNDGNGIEIGNLGSNILIANNVIDNNNAEGIRGNSPVTIQSNNITGSSLWGIILVSGATGSLIDSNNLTNNNNAIQLFTSDDHNVSNNYAKGPGSAVIIVAGSNNNRIFGNVFDNTTLYGVQIANGTGQQIYNNTFVNYASGAYSAYVQTSDNNIYNNSFLNSYHGMRVEGGNNNITYNTFYNHTNVHISTETASSDGNRIEHNNITLAGTGVSVGSGSENGVIYNNSFISTSYGVTSTTASNGWNISNNVFTSNSQAAWYALASSDFNTIANNIISGTGTRGLYITSGSDGNTISNNTITDKTTAGIEVVNGSSNTFEFNNISNNALGFIINSTASGLTMSENYFSNAGTNIYLSAINGSNLLNNTIKGGTRGIYMASSSNSDITFNNISNISTNPSIEVSSGTDNDFLNNTLSNGSIGLYLGSASNMSFIINNTFDDFTSYPLALVGSGAKLNTVYTNTITDSAFGISVLGSDSNNIGFNNITNVVNWGIGVSGTNELVQGNLVNGATHAILLLNNSNNTTIQNNYLYNSSVDTAFNSGSGATNIITNLYLPDSGVLANFSNVSLSIAGLNSTQTLNLAWATQPPGSFPWKQFFAGKNFNIEDFGTGVNLTNLTFHWTDSESATFDESGFELWAYDGSWVNTSAILNITANTLSLFNYSGFSTFSILAPTGNNIISCIDISNISNQEYNITTNLTGTGTSNACVSISNSDNITIDCLGNYLIDNQTSMAPSTYGFQISNSDDIEIKNCNLINYTFSTYSFSSNNTNIHDINASSWKEQPGYAFVGGDNNSLSNARAVGSAMAGFAGSMCNNISVNDFYLNGGIIAQPFPVFYTSGCNDVTINDVLIENSETTSSTPIALVINSTQAAIDNLTINNYTNTLTGLFAGAYGGTYNLTNININNPMGPAIQLSDANITLDGFNITNSIDLGIMVVGQNSTGDYVVNIKNGIASMAPSSTQIALLGAKMVGGSYVMQMNITNMTSNQLGYNGTGYFITYDAFDTIDGFSTTTPLVPQGPATPSGYATFDNFFAGFYVDMGDTNFDSATYYYDPAMVPPQNESNFVLLQADQSQWVNTSYAIDTVNNKVTFTNVSMAINSSDHNIPGAPTLAYFGIFETIPPAFNLSTYIVDIENMNNYDIASANVRVDARAALVNDITSIWNSYYFNQSGATDDNAGALITDGYYVWAGGSVNGNNFASIQKKEMVNGRTEQVVYLSVINDEKINDMAQNDSSLFIAASERITSSSNGDIWAINKSNLATIWNVEYTGANASAMAIASDSYAVYAGGYQSSTDSSSPSGDSIAWIRAFNTSTGATLWTSTYDPDSGITFTGGLDTDGTYIYAAVTEAGSGADRDWRIFSRYNNNGSNVWNTSVDFNSTQPDHVFGIAEDNDAVYAVGYASVSGQSVAAVKFNKTTGAQIWNVTYNISASNEQYNRVEVYGDYLYVVGNLGIFDILNKYDGSVVVRYTIENPTDNANGDVKGISLANDSIYTITSEQSRNDQGTLNEYQQWRFDKLQLATSGKYSDLKVTLYDSTSPLNYCFETVLGECNSVYNASSSGYIWVKIPSLTARAITRLHIQPMGMAVDGKQVFPLYDDFNDGSVNVSLWMQNNTASTTISESGGALHLATTAPGNWIYLIANSPSYTNTSSLSISSRFAEGSGTSPSTSSITFGINDLDGTLNSTDQNPTSFGGYIDAGNSLCYILENGGATGGIICPDDTYRYISVEYFPSDISGTIYQDYNNTVNLFDGNIASSSFNNPGYVFMKVTRPSNSGTTTGDYDWIKVANQGQIAPLVKVYDADEAGLQLYATRNPLELNDTFTLNVYQLGFDTNTFDQCFDQDCSGSSSGPHGGDSAPMNYQISVQKDTPGFLIVNASTTGGSFSNVIWPMLVRNLYNEPVSLNNTQTDLTTILENDILRPINVSSDYGFGMLCSFQNQYTQNVSSYNRSFADPTLLPAKTINDSTSLIEYRCVFDGRNYDHNSIFLNITGNYTNCGNNYIGDLDITVSPYTANGAYIDSCRIDVLNQGGESVIMNNTYIRRVNAQTTNPKIIDAYNSYLQGGSGQTGLNNLFLYMTNSTTRLFGNSSYWTSARTTINYTNGYADLNETATDANAQVNYTALDLSSVPSYQWYRGVWHTPAIANVTNMTNYIVGTGSNNATFYQTNGAINNTDVNASSYYLFSKYTPYNTTLPGGYFTGFAFSQHPNPAYVTSCSGNTECKNFTITGIQVLPVNSNITFYVILKDWNNNTLNQTASETSAVNITATSFSFGLDWNGDTALNTNHTRVLANRLMYWKFYYPLDSTLTNPIYRDPFVDTVSDNNNITIVNPLTIFEGNTLCPVQNRAIYLEQYAYYIEAGANLLIAGTENTSLNTRFFLPQEAEVMIRGHRRDTGAWETYTGYVKLSSGGNCIIASTNIPGTVTINTSLAGNAFYGTCVENLNYSVNETSTDCLLQASDNATFGDMQLRFNYLQNQSNIICDTTVVTNTTNIYLNCITNKSDSGNPGVDGGIYEVRGYVDGQQVFYFLGNRQSEEWRHFGAYFYYIALFFVILFFSERFLPVSGVAWAAGIVVVMLLSNVFTLDMASTVALGFVALGFAMFIKYLGNKKFY